MDKVCTVMTLVSERYPWWVGRRGEFGWQVLCKFATYNEAHRYAMDICTAYGDDPMAVSASNVRDGAELWPLEYAINHARHERGVELMKWRVNTTRVKCLQMQISRLTEEAFFLAELRGQSLAIETRDGQLRLAFAGKDTVTMRYLGQAQSPQYLLEEAG